MRKSQVRTRARLVRAGVAVGTVSAAALVAPLIAPGAAFAAVAVSPPTAPVGATVTITDTDNSPFGSSGTPAVELQTAACGTRYTTTGTAVFAVATVTRNSASSLAFTVPATAVANANGVAKRYNVCVYDSTSTTTSVRYGQYVFNAGTPPTLNPAAGVSGGGNTVVVTPASDAPIFGTATTIGAIFAAAGAGCPTAYGTPAANLSTSATKAADGTVSLTVPSGVVTSVSGGQPSPYELCLYGGATAASTLLGSAEYGVNQVAPSQPSGPSAGGNALTFTSPDPIFSGITTFGMSFTTNAACPDKYNSTGTNVGANPPVTTNVLVTASTIRKLGDDRIGITVPALTSATYRVCIFNGAVNNSSDLIATGRYAGTTVQAPTAIKPGSGSSLGGSRVTVVGTDFPTTAGSITATLGGSPLTDIRPISATAFSAVTPARSPGAAVLVVTTDKGQSVLPSAYTYQSSLRVSPNTAPNTAPVDVLVKGAGFQGVTWGAIGTQTAGESHIYLVRGTYSSVNTGSARANPPIAECTSVLAFSDNELVCTLPLDQRLNAAGLAAADPTATPPAAAAATITAAAGSRLVTGTFSRAQIGMYLSHTGFTGLVRIVDVISATQAIVASAANTGAGADATATIVPNSQTKLPVPEGVYNMTYVSSGATEAFASESNYVQSVISSGSTFTVANF